MPVSNMMEDFCYTGGYGVIHIKAFNRRASLGYVQVASGY